MVSVVVPIFNREQYLRRCISSIVAQTYTDIEIILIDDGSTDTSGEICDEYAVHDHRIHVIHQQNAGLSISRIRGIELAHGEFVLFVDSDDWIELNMVECMLREARTKEVDVVWCDFLFHLPEEQVFVTPFISDPSAMLNAIYRDMMFAFVWNKLYRTDLWRNLEPSRNDILEDMFYTTQILSRQPSMSFVHKPFYHYDQTPVDTLTKSDDFVAKALTNFEHCYQYLVAHQCLSLYKVALSCLSMKFKFVLLNQGRLREAQHYATFANRSIRNYPVSFPVSLIYWIGFNVGDIGRVLLSAYMRYWRHIYCK